MDENKQIDITENTQIAGSDGTSATIDFDKLMVSQEDGDVEIKKDVLIEDNQAKQEVKESDSKLFEQNNIEKTEQVENVEQVPSVNKSFNPFEDKQEETQIDISSIQIEDLDNKKVKAESETLGESGIGTSNMVDKVSEFNYLKLVFVANIVIFVCLIISGIAYIWNKYLDVVKEPIVEPKYQTYVSYIKDGQKLLGEYTDIDDYYKLYNTNFLSQDGKSNVLMIQNSDRLSYAQKKDILQLGLNNISYDVINNLTKLNEVKQTLSKYGFFPQDLINIFDESEQDISIKKSLMSLELIKFTTAIKVFSYLDTFLKGLSNIVKMDTNNIQLAMKDLDKRGGRDIQVYLNNCYLNPFEIDSCDMVGDFDRYYKYVEPNLVFDKSFFKNIMRYIDIKLENTDIPSFSINFKNFNPRDKKISFDIQVDTLKEDELSLIAKGIVNPHLFVVTQLFNLLKQSLFVVGENINDRQIKINSRTVQIGNIRLPVNSSNMYFELPIQVNPQREISDFILKIDNLSDLGGLEDLVKLNNSLGLVEEDGQESSGSDMVIEDVVDVEDIENSQSGDVVSIIQ